MKPLHLVLLIAMNILWAASYSAFKALSPHLDAGGVATMRFGLAAAVMLVCWPWLPGNAPRGRDLVTTLVMGLIVFVLAPRLQVAGVQRGQATDASVLMALEPLVGSILAAIFLHEHIGPRRLVGFALGLVGVVLMAEVWRPDFRLPGLAADALIVTSFFCESAYSILGKPMLGRVGLTKIFTVAVTAGTLVNLLVDGPQTCRAAAVMPAHAWAMLAYLTLICTVAGYILWFVVIRETEVNVTVLPLFVQPVAGVAIAMLTLGESLKWGQLWGSVAIVIGLAIGLSRQVARPEQPASQ